MIMKADKKAGLLKEGGMVLLIVLLLLTFVSNEFMFHVPPLVSIETVESGKLTAAIRGSGTVMSAGAVNITCPADRIVKKVEAKEGQRLNKGDIIFSFGSDPDGTLDEEMEELDALFREYDSYAAQSPLLEDTTEVSVTLQKLKTEMDRLEYYGIMDQYAAKKAEYDQINYTVQSKKQYVNNGIEVIDASLASLAERIKEQQKLIRTLKGEGSETSICAPDDCTITKINCTDGDRMKRGDVLCVLETENSPHILSITVTKEQADCLKVGDIAEVGSGYIETGVSAKLRNMKTADNGKLVTFDLTGRVNTGEELTLYVGKQSSDFDMLLPSSAIHTDSNGSYVLTVRSTGSSRNPIYIATRAAVEILASDDTLTAVTGRINKGDWVVTNTDSPIANGDQVRLS